MAHRISKALRFGMTDTMPGQFRTNEDWLLDEFNELVGMMQMLREEGIIKKAIFNQQTSDDKKERVERFLKYSQEMGTLTPPPVHISVPDIGFRNDHNRIRTRGKEEQDDKY